MKTARKLHLYIGLLLAPSLLFFAFTGALQTFGFHERERDGDYRPPHWIQELAQVHKKQTLDLPVRGARAHGPEGRGGGDGGEEGRDPDHPGSVLSRR